MNASPTSSSDDSTARSLPALALSALAVGALAGLIGSAFYFAVDHTERVLMSVLDWARDYPALGWIVPVSIAALAAFVARWLVRFAPETAGSGVQHVEAVIRGDAAGVNAAAVPVKFVGGVLALGSGMALGREGPTVQMGATIGHLWARRFKVGYENGRALLAAGAGAGLAVAFNAPLAGAIFVFEELLRRFEIRAAVAAVAACSSGLVVMRVLLGDRPIFSVEPIAVDIFPGYFMFLALGAVVGVLGALYSRLVVLALDASDRMKRIAPEIRAAIVGAIVGLLAWLTPHIIGGGEKLVQAALDGGHSPRLVVVLLIVRLVLGPLCYAPGLPGGLFAPLLVVGAAAGLLFGIAMEAMWPALKTPQAAFAAVGMGALFVAIVRAPLTGIALVVEMTAATTLFVPLLTACVAAVAVPTMLGSRPIYDTLRDRERAHTIERASK